MGRLKATRGHGGNDHLESTSLACRARRTMTSATSRPLATELRNRARSLLGRVASHPRVLPLTALLLRAHIVRRPGLFAMRELTGSRRVAVYTLRHNRAKVALRHGSGDVVTLGEVFHDHTYLPIEAVEQALGRVDSIIDLGANIGLFGVFAAVRWPEARIVAFEPDPANATVHERTVAENGLGGRWTLTHAAAGASDGVAEFAAGQVALSHLADSNDGEPTITVPVHDVLPDFGKVDLVKMDIEGGEWAILMDPRFREASPRALVMEYHPRLCPAAEPHGAIAAALECAGLRVQWIWRREDGHGMLWAWRA